MEKQEITEKLTSIFRIVFEDASMVIDEAMKFNEITRWDSLSHMLLLSNVENEFGIKFILKDLIKLKNVGDLVTTINSKIISH